MGIREWSPFHERFGRKPSVCESSRLALSHFGFRSIFSSFIYPLLIKFLLLVGRRGARRAGAPIPAFHQSDSSLGLVPIATANEGVQALATSRIVSALVPGRLEAVPRVGTPILQFIR